MRINSSSDSNLENSILYDGPSSMALRFYDDSYLDRLKFGST